MSKYFYSNSTEPSRIHRIHYRVIKCFQQTGCKLDVTVGSSKLCNLHSLPDVARRISLLFNINNIFPLTSLTAVTCNHVNIKIQMPKLPFVFIRSSQGLTKWYKQMHKSAQNLYNTSSIFGGYSLINGIRTICSINIILDILKNLKLCLNFMAPIVIKSDDIDAFRSTMADYSWLERRNKSPVK